MNRGPEGLRQQTEHKIDRRMRTSQWVQRGLFGTGIVAGVLAGVHDAKDGVGLASETSTVVAVSAGVLSLTERILARRGCSRIVDRYAEDVGADPASREMQLVLGVENGKLTVERRYDFDSSASVHISNLLPIFAPAEAWGGAFMTTYAPLNEHVAEIGAQVPATTLGVALLGAGTLMHVVDQMAHTGEKRKYVRQLDNIDSGIVFEQRPEDE